MLARDSYTDRAAATPGAAEIRRNLTPPCAPVDVVELLGRDALRRRGGLRADAKGNIRLAASVATVETVDGKPTKSGNRWMLERPDLPALAEAPGLPALSKDAAA